MESSSSSDASGFGTEGISNYEQELEEYESLSDGTSDSHVAHVSEEISGMFSAPAPYDDEPIADEEWVRRHEEKKEKESSHAQTLQDRLDDKISISDW